MKSEDRSPGDTARQERCARRDASELARKICLLKKEDKATLYSLSEEWIFPSASTINPEEIEFVVDSGASMHMVSKKDLDEVELETVRISKNPRVVMTANGEVLAKEEATVCVHELDLFVTVMLLGRNTRSSFTSKTLRRIWVQLPLDECPETTSHKESQDNFIATHQILYRTSYLVYPRVPLPHHSPASTSQNTVTDTEIPATSRSEKASEDSSARGNSWHASTEIENPSENDDEELQSGELQGVRDWLQEFEDGLVDESVPEHRDASSSSHEFPLELRAKVTE